MQPQSKQSKYVHTHTQKKNREKKKKKKEEYVAKHYCTVIYRD
jgi:hypothetical protein